MRIIEGSENFPEEAKGAALALGNFDGVHLGHKALIAKIEETKRTDRARSAVYTFEPHPVKILSPSQCPRLLTTLEQKLELLEDCGVDIAVVEPFTADLAKLTAERFFEEILLGRVAPRAIVAGYDFTFGLHREGTIETLEEMGRTCGVDVTIVPAVFAGETLVSSTVIRMMVAEGDIEGAAQLLGRNYSIAGKVVPGRGLGTSLSARTANIEPINEIIPNDGVYVTLAQVEGGADPMPSVTSIGDNPTFPDARFSIETHILDEEMELLGRKMTIHFIAFMRETLRFATIEELKAQIGRDVEGAREYHSKAGIRD